MTEKAVTGRAPWKREDALVWALKVAESRVPVSVVLDDADRISNFLNGEGSTAQRPEWAEVSAFQDVVAERERARDTAARLEQELAEKQRELDTARDNMTKGALLRVLFESKNFASTDAAAVALAVNDAAKNFGVTL